MESSEENKGSPGDINIRRRSIKVKNLEEEVDLILSQDEDEGQTEPPSPSSSGDGQQQSRIKDAATPRASEMGALKDMLQTPRRSCRKSVKPAQDYDDIVKKSMRSVGRSAKKSLMVFNEEENEENEESVQTEEDSQHHKWTVAEVGKSSTKRVRKSRRNTTGTKGKKTKKDNNEENQDCSQRKLDMEISEDNSSETIKIDQVLAETVQHEVPKTQDKIDNDDFPIENSKETVHEENIQSVGVCIIPEIVIESPKEYIEIKEETPLEASEQLLLHEEQQKTEECIETHEENIEENEDVEKQANVDEVVETEEDSEDIIHLIQEDSEDFKDMPITNVNKQPETGDIKANNAEIDSNINIKEDKETSNDSFGSYLKSNKINVTDLGLIPLNDEDDAEETDDNNISTSGQLVDGEDMPSLIILDDDEDVEVEVEATNNEKVAEECNVKPKLNATFETIEVIKQEVNTTQRISFEVADMSLQSFLINEAAAKVSGEETMEMDALKMSDDEETPRKAPRIVLTAVDQQNKTLLSTPKGLANPSTPKHKAKPFRFPTPHRHNVNREPSSSTKKLPLHHNNMGLALSSLEPREIVLRGIRKRSLSICLGGGEVNNVIVAGGSAAKRKRPLKGPLATHRQQKVVNFYSPANQTTIIDDLDKIIEDSVRKDKKVKTIHQITNVTTRRKRSLSLDETTMSKSLTSKIPRPGAANNSLAFTSTGSSSSASTSTASTSSSKLARTKLPNFAAIHQKHFQKMENLVDHVARKNERSKVLINSASKIKTASAQKNISANRIEKSSHLEKPKVYKKIDLGGTSQTKTKPLFNSLATKTATKTCNNAPKKPAMKENMSMLEETSLPHPRDLQHPKVFKLVNKHQQHLLNKQQLKPTQTINVLANTKSSSSSILTPSKKQPQKPFNLSTQLPPTRPQVVKAAAASTSSATKSSSTANTASLSMQDKMASRLQRHMDLFKGRVPTARSGVAVRKTDANIRGVRSNRRFELQMQHRKNLEN